MNRKKALRKLYRLSGTQSSGTGTSLRRRDASGRVIIATRHIVGPTRPPTPAPDSVLNNSESVAQKEKLPVGVCHCRVGVSTSHSGTLLLVGPTRRFQKATRPDTGATRTHRGRLAGPTRRTPGPLALPSGSTGGRLAAGRVATRCGEAPGRASRPAGSHPPTHPLARSAARVGARHYRVRRHYLWGPFLQASTS